MALEVNPYQTVALRGGGVGGYQGYNQGVNPFGGVSTSPVSQPATQVNEEDKYVAAASANYSASAIEQANTFAQSGGILALAGIDPSASLGSSNANIDTSSWAENGGAPVNDGSGFYGGTVGANLDVSLDKLADYYC